MSGPLPATQRGTLLAAVKATPFGWPTASLDPSCGAAPGNRRRDRSPKNGPTTKIHQSEVSTLSGDGRQLPSGDGWAPRALSRGDPGLFCLECPRQLGSACDAELCVGPGEVAFDGLDRDVEGLGDLP